MEGPNISNFGGVVGRERGWSRADISHSSETISSMKVSSYFRSGIRDAQASPDLSLGAIRAALQQVCAGMEALARASASGSHLHLSTRTDLDATNPHTPPPPQ
jgi:hypothetical protein